MNKKPLPQFNSLAEAKAYYGKFGRLQYFGRGGDDHKAGIYTYHVKDGRVLRIYIYENGKVEEIVTKRNPPIS